MVLGQSRGITVIPRYLQNLLPSCRSNGGTVYEAEEEGCRGLHVSASKKKGILHFLSSLFLMSPPMIIFVIYSFFAMLLEFPNFPSGFGVFRMKVIFTLGWLKLCYFLFPRHS